MASNSSIYKEYKENQRLALEWLIPAFNRLVRAKQRITTSRVSTSEILHVCQKIADKRIHVPGEIRHRLHQTIVGRTTLMHRYSALMDKCIEYDLQKSFDAHRNFNDNLKKALSVLTMEDRMEFPDAKTSRVEGILHNKFSLLADGDDRNSNSSDDYRENMPDDSLRAQNTRHAKKGGRKQKSKAKSREPGQSDASSDGYRIIEDSEGKQRVLGDCFLAAAILLEETARHRSQLQALWRDVMYSNLNSAVAAGMSKVAVSSVERAENDIFVNFNGRDSFEDVIQTVTFGDVDRMSDRGFLDAVRQRPFEETTALEVREVFLIHMYDHVCDFVTDFRKNGSGKPTKAMSANLKQWSIDSDLKSMSHDQRLSWRRCLTIGWLYELVSAKQSASTKTPSSDNHSEVLGLDKLATKITKIATSKTDEKKIGTRQMISPSLVFELQCVVDSICAGRGWFINALGEHDIEERPSKNFSARRDIEHFLHTEHTGVLHILETVKEFLKNKTDVGRLLDRVEQLGDNLTDRLGGNTDELDTYSSKRLVVSSKLSVSPYFCGAGLIDGLNTVYKDGAMILDEMIEPLLVMHLHRMLWRKGHMKPSNMLCYILEMRFHKYFFDGDISSNFDKQNVESYNDRYFLDAFKERMQRTTNLLDCCKPFLHQLCTAEWDIERLSDRDIPVPGSYSLVRAGLQSRIAHHLPDQKELIKRWQAFIPDIELTNRLVVLPPGGELPLGFTPIGSSKLHNCPSSTPDDKLRTKDLFWFILQDIEEDIDVKLPRHSHTLSNLNLFAIYCRLTNLWVEIVNHLAETKTALGNLASEVRRHEGNGFYGKVASLRLVEQILTGDEAESLPVIAEIFQQNENCDIDVYFNNKERQWHERHVADQRAQRNCCVM